MSYNVEVKKKNLILGLLLGLGLAFFVPQQAVAIGGSGVINDRNGYCNLEIEQAGFPDPDCLDRESPITFKITNATWKGNIYTGAIAIKLGGGGAVKQLDSNGALTATIPDPSWIATGKNKKVDITNRSVIFYNLMCRTTISKFAEKCTDEERIKPENMPFEICNQIPKSKSIPKKKCEDCLKQGGIWTAIGCIDASSTEGIVGKLMTVGISIAGGIALLMILAAAFMFSTSEGEPKRTSEAKEILTSAIIGLIFIIFSVTLLQFIGVNILKIPGFGEQ